MNPENNQTIGTDTTVTDNPPTTQLAATPTVVPMEAQPQKAKPKNQKTRILALIAIGVAILSGSGAAAYFGVVVPNRPENILKSAITNTLSQKQISAKGVVDIENTDASSGAYTLKFESQANAAAKTFAMQMELTTSGVKLPLEARYVDTNIYVKVGDLGTIKSLALAYAPNMGQFVDTLSQKLSNKWIEIDHSLLKQAKMDCVLDSSGLTTEDINLLVSAYHTNPFATIKSTTSEKLDGKDSIKYVIDVNDNKSAEYAKKLDNLSIIKKLKSCNKDSKVLDTASIADGDTTPLTLWVDKSSKRISKIASESTPQDAQKSHLKAKLSATLSYNAVDIKKPDGATPFMQLYGEILQSFQQGFGEELDAGYPTSNILSQTLGVFDVREQ